MPSYKDTERQTPEQLAEFILKERVCKNCKWWNKSKITPPGMGICKNDVLIIYTNNASGLNTEKYFGCNQWEKNGND